MATTEANPRNTETKLALPAGLLADLTGKVAPAAAGKSYNPYCTMLRVKATPAPEPGYAGALTLTATDMTWAVEATVALDPERSSGELDVLIDAGRFASLVKTFRAESEVTLDLRGTELAVLCDRSRSRFKTAPGEEHPAFPDVTQTTRLFTCLGEDLKRAADLTVWAAARDDSRPLLQNVAVTVYQDKPSGDGPGGGSVRFEATDGFTVAVWEGLGGGEPDRPEFCADSKFLLPVPVNGGAVLTNMGRLTGAAAFAGAVVTLAAVGPAANPNGVILDASTEDLALAVYARCSEEAGSFPDMKGTVEKIVREEHGDQWAAMTVSPAAVVTALGRIVPFAGEVERGPNGQRGMSGKPVCLTLKADTVWLECHQAEHGEGTDAIDAETEGLADREVWFGSDFLKEAMDAIRAVDPEGRVRIVTADPFKPSTFHPAGIAGYTGIVMPLDPGKAAKR